MKINLKTRRLAESLMWRFFATVGMTFRLRSGLQVTVADRHEMATFKEIFVQQEYDDFLDQLPLPTSVLDLGCNSGFFAMLMLNRAIVHKSLSLPKLVLVDANAQAVERARVVIAGSGQQSEITYITGLIGRRGESEASFYLSPASAESSAQNRTKHAREVRVKTVDMDALTNLHFPDGLDLIKCDIEGGEELMIRDWASSLQKTKSLLIEWHGFDGSWDAFQAQLMTLGLKLHSEKPAGKYKNALFTRL